MREFSNRNLTEIFLFVVILNTVVFLATAVLHEFGHAIIGLLHSCRSIQIVIFEFATQSTYTAMDCAVTPPPYEVYFSSYLFVLPLSITLLLLRDFKEQYVGLIMLGGNILGSITDLTAFLPGTPLIFPGVVLGLLLILIGEDHLVHTTVTQRTPTILDRWLQETGKTYKDGTENEGEDADTTISDTAADTDRDTGSSSTPPDQSTAS